MLKRIKIGDLIQQKKAHSQTGPFGTQLKASDYVEEGIPVINVRNIGFGEVRADKLEYVDEEMAKELKSHKLKENDIVFGRKGAVERHSLISKNEDGWIQGSDCIRLRFLTDKFDPVFISYFFRTEYHKQWMMNLGSFGATMSSLNQEIVSKIEIPDISLQTQTKIASILSAYNELIENNKQRIKLLEEMAEEIYKEWFVRFRFPGYGTTRFLNEQGREVPHGTPGALPEQWEKVRINEVTNNYDSKREPLSSVVREKIPGSYPYYGAAKIIDRIDNYIFDGKYLLLAEDGSVITTGGYPVLQFVNEKFWVSNHAHVLEGKNPISTEFIYLSLSKYFIIGLVTGAAQPKINQENLNRILILKPSEYYCKRFNDIIIPFFDEILILNKKNELLQQTRDLLLPRLISGRLSVVHLVEEELEPLAMAAEPEATFGK